MSTALARLFHVDAFTTVPFAGNAAGVVVLDAATPEAWMQAVAAELQQSETAFVVPADNGFAIRWFTPAVEVELCGHATLAAAHVLWDEGLVAATQPITLASASGPLTCTRLDDGAIRLDFPIDVPRPCEAPPGLIEALSVPVLAVERGRFDYLIQVADEATVRALHPDLQRLVEVETRGVCVTAPADTDGLDFVSRFFAPRGGIDEDPVTGSAHCKLIPYWSRRLGRTRLFARQVSWRGGELWCEDRGARVTIAGQGVIYLEGSVEI